MDTLINKLPFTLDWQKLNQALPIVFNILLILAISYALAQLTWLLAPEESEVYAQPTRSSNAHLASKQSAQQSLIQQIPQSHLFGKYEATITQAVETVAPDTRLNLVLKGVFASNPMDRASAIISMGKRGKENVYGIGDKISAATIREIHPDRIILERSGRFETLRLPKEFGSAPLVKTKNRKASGSTRPKTPGQVLGNIRKKIIQNPTSFGQYAIPIPYNVNGKLKGYRLQPQKDRALFDEVGLKSTDVVIGINGVKLDNPANGLKALRALQSAKQVNITVLRDGVEMPLSFEIP